MAFAYIIVVILGMIFGFGWNGAGGMVVSGLAGFLLVSVYHLRQRLGALEDAFEIYKAAQKTDYYNTAKDTSKTTPGKIRDVFTGETEKKETGVDVPVDRNDDFFHIKETKPDEDQPEPPPIPVWAEDVDGKESVMEENKAGGDSVSKTESLIRDLITKGNIVVKVGLVVLFFGVSFLLKYAAEHNKLPVELRYVGVAAGAVILLVTGWRMRLKYRVYSLLIQGGATGILYMTIFAAARLHSLIPMGFAFSLMVFLVALSCSVAVLQNARITAFFSVAGGFLAPVLTSSGSGNHVMLFTYYALLNSGILGVAWFKSWRELNLTGFVFTLGIGSAWGVSEYRPELFVTVEPFLILFFLYFAFISILFAFRQPRNLKGYVDGTLVFGLPVSAFTLQGLLVKDMDFGLPVSALALSVFYIVIAKVLWNKTVEGMRTLTEAFLALGIVFGSLAIPLSMDGRWTAAAWAMEGAALIWVGVRQHRLKARIFGLILQAGAGITFILEFGRPASDIPIINGFYLGCLMIGVSALFTAYYLWINAKELHPWERKLHWGTLVWGLLWWYGAGLYEIDTHMLKRFEFAGSVLFMGGSACLLSMMITRLEWHVLTNVLFLLMPVFIVLLGVQTGFLNHTHPFKHYGFIAWPVSVSVFYYCLWQHEVSLGKLWRCWQHRLSFWFCITLLTMEAAWGMKQLAGFSGTWDFIAWGAVPGGCLLATLRGGDTIKWPFNTYRTDYRTFGMFPVVLYLVLWIVSGSLQNPGDPSPLPYIPLLNPLEIIQVFVLFVAYGWGIMIQKEEHIIRSAVNPLWLNYTAAVILFLVINTILARMIHVYTGVPFKWGQLFNSVVYQTSVSILWTILSLGAMIIAAKKGGRALWFTGAILLAVVVIKLFMKDLSGSGTIARIISFLVVGLLMLVVGFFSPLPPGRQPVEDKK